MSAQPPKTVITSTLSVYIEGIMSRWGIPGLALGVVRPDGEVELQGWGVRNDAGEAVTPDTLFGIASCSKAFSAFGTALLIQDYAAPSGPPAHYAPLPGGLTSLDWYTRVKALLPDFELVDKHAEEGMRVVDLVSHMSGLPTHDIGFTVGEERDTVLKRLKHMPPNRSLREEWQYNNLMFMTNARLISTLARTPYPTFVKTRIFDPLRMSDSTYSPTQTERTGRFSHAFQWIADGEGGKVCRAEPHFIDEPSVGLMAAGGGIISTASDMTNWLKLLLAQGVNPHTGEPLLPAEQVKYMLTGHVVGGFFGGAPNPSWPEVSTTLYGTGWFVHSYQGHELVYHTGGTPGISAYQVVLPNDGLGLVILTNTGRKQQILLGLIHRIMEEWLGLPQVDWETRFEDEESAASARAKAAQKPRSANASPPLPLSSYAGSYNSPAYGPLTLYTPSVAPPDIAHAFRTIDASPSAPFAVKTEDVPELWARFPRVWGNHLRLRHHEGPLWKATLEALYPEGYGRDKTPFGRVGDGPFDVLFEEGEGEVKGLSMVRWSLAQNVRKGDYERAKVWFAKVG